MSFSAMEEIINDINCDVLSVFYSEKNRVHLTYLTISLFI